MSASLLLAYVSAVLLAQLVLGFVILWRRPRRDAATGAPVAPAAVAGAWEGWREFRVETKRFEDAARTQCSFHLQPVDGVELAPFTPGQYLTFALSTASGRTLKRCYSLSDGPNPSGYRITVKRVLAPVERPELPPGACSSHLHDSVQIGDILKVKAPAGRFGALRDSSVPVVLIAGGIGITPLLSMLRGGLGADPSHPVHLYYGVRCGAEHAFKEELRELASRHPALRVNVVYSRPAPEDVSGRDFQHSGRIDVDLLRRTLPAGRHRFYVCGPPGMMASLIPALGQWGVLPEDIHHEAFGPASTRSAPPAPSADPSPAGTSIEVAFRRSARTLVWDGQDANLLEFAERHDISVESGCRAGSCGSCEVRVVSGKIRYAQQPEHEVAPGHCLLCVGVPDSRLEIDA